MTTTSKEQRKALKTTITNAINIVLSKNKHLKDKKVQKTIDEAASEIAKKITKVAIVKVPAVLVVKKTAVPTAKKATASKATKLLKVPAVKKVANAVKKTILKKQD